MGLSATVGREEQPSEPGNQTSAGSDERGARKGGGTVVVGGLTGTAAQRHAVRA